MNALKTLSVAVLLACVVLVTVAYIVSTVPADKRASICPAVGEVVRPSGTPEQVCGKVPRGPGAEVQVVVRCWNVVTAAWERYYQCGRRAVARDGGGES